jgi:eukaryotic-like serine/threonine-protein kinase
MSNNGRDLYEFGPFRLDPAQRLLLREDKPIPLQPKAFDTLLVLVRNNEKVVLKDEILSSVWPDTFVEEANLTQNIFVLRKALKGADDERRYILTVPGQGYRFAETVRIRPHSEVRTAEPAPQTQVVPQDSAEETKGTQWPARAILGACVTVLVLALAAFLSLHFGRKPRLTDRDTIVLGDFTNTTGDTVFDGSLRQAISMQLEQSPFLNLLSDQRIGETLLLMSKPKDTKLTLDVAQDVCQRTASVAVLYGSISQIGTRYLLTLQAMNCSTGERLASSHTQASDKDRILDAVGEMASQIRGQLGESLASVKKFDTPLEDVTTPSLEALKAYTLAHTQQVAGHVEQGNALYRRAISLDPHFAMAYEGLGINYFNIDESTLAAENTKKAYEMRDRLSERQKLGLEVIYYAVVNRDYEAAAKSALLATQIYPRDARALGNLAVCYGYLGEYEKALAAAKQAWESNPASAQHTANVLILYLQLNRLQEARAVAKQAKVHNMDTSFLDANLYLVEFVDHDPAGMEREAAEVLGAPGTENKNLMYYYESDTAAYGGKLAEARALTRRAEELSSRSDDKEATATYEAEAAVREALVNNLAQAKQKAKHALSLSDGRDVVAMSAVALGLAGDTSKAASLASRLSTQFPRDTVVIYNSLPSIRAAIALRKREPEKALEALSTATPYELGQTAQQVTFVLYPVYLRGEAFLATHQSEAAVAEFQKVLDHPGLVQNEVIGALAHLGLGRAYALSHDNSNAKLAYEDFFALWKNADPDILILKEAKVEYARLR